MSQGRLSVTSGDLMNVCSRCGDVVMYCSCQRTDSAWSSHKELTENPTFWIYRGHETAEWDRDGRALFGDPELVADIRFKLSGERELVLLPEYPLAGFMLLMAERDPYAVHLAAQSIDGCTFSPSAPNWGTISRPPETH